MSRAGSGAWGGGSGRAVSAAGAAGGTAGGDADGAFRAERLPLFGRRAGLSLSIVGGRRDRSRYLDAQRLAAANLLFPDDEEFALPALKVGLDRSEDPGAAIPAPLLYAIGWIESTTNQAAEEVPYGEIGPALVSFDCGYGIMQVTSAILNEGGLPTRFEALVGTHFAYNIAAGAQILAEKWNDDFFPQVGAADSRGDRVLVLRASGATTAGRSPIIRPGRRSTRSARRHTPATDGAHGFPYQELVLGCVANPPLVDGRPLWEAVPVALPDLAVTAAPGGPLDPAHFYAGLNDLRNVAAGRFAPFAAMQLPLSEFAAPYAAAPPGAAEAQQLRRQILGEPRLRLDVEEIALDSESGAPAASLVIENEGSGLLAWRVARAPSWVEINVQAGVALGAEAPNAGVSTLVVRAAAGGVPEGEHIGQIRLEAMLPDGSTVARSIAVSLNKQGAAFYEAGNPQS